MIDPQTTGNRIVATRRDKNITREELSVRMGVDEWIVAEWEEGLSMPDLEALCRLSRVLGRPIEYYIDANAAQPASTRNLYGSSSGDILTGMRDSPIMVEFGSQIGTLMLDFSKNCAPEIVSLRMRIPKETGVLLPGIRMMDEGNEDWPMKCTIRFFGRVMWENTFPDAQPFRFGELMAELERLIRDNLSLFVNRHMVALLVENLRASFPYSVQGVVPDRISLTRLKRVCKALVADGVSIKNFLSIIEAADDAVDEGADDEALIRAVKRALIG